MNCVHYNFHMYHVSACVRVYYQWYDAWRVSARVSAVCASRTRTLWHARDRTVCAMQYFCTKLAHGDVLTCNMSACVQLACVGARTRTHGHPETCKRRQTSPRTNACAHFTHDAAPGYETIWYACTNVCASKICMKCVCRVVCVRQASTATVARYTVCCT